MLERINRAYIQIARAQKSLGRKINIMEVCGTHTVNVFRAGLRDAFPEGMRLLSGPGCPVCITDQGYIDAVLSLADRDDCIIATYGDMIRVPGRNGSLEQRTNRGNIKIVLSAEDALKLAKQNPDKKIVFVAIGFETTAPATAVIANEAIEQGIKNLFIFSNHKLVIPAMKALLSEKNHKIDAFMCPGHVSVIIGSDAYKPIVEQFKRPCVVAGFEPMQIVEAISEICRQLADNTPAVDSVYPAAVTAAGNKTAQKIIEETFDAVDGCWRGLGNIDKSTLKLKGKFSELDAEKQLGVKFIHEEDLTGCQCGQVLCGLMDPPDCGLFAKSCTPDTPVGPCMVSSEGACAAWFKYTRRKRRNQ
ncbi:MAG: hydrogenase formation protein HypD [Planctomycetes bacterium]|nr:hydrogenase formation protein HypD [Planctomycetota bacterium]MBU1517681.1 hydrogenase formation protein HypD [Planctomycetota bacterium]MBU2458695.1 hydrogenase formation protein HypD [Planctomycetota bacterium]MBU2597018.1 hydrogenase formation protein HypD [Planctomycetota bacterium]